MGDIETGILKPFKNFKMWLFVDNVKEIVFEWIKGERKQCEEIVTLHTHTILMSSCSDYFRMDLEVILWICRHLSWSVRSVNSNSCSRKNVVLVTNPFTSLSGSTQSNIGTQCDYSVRDMADYWSRKYSCFLEDWFLQSVEMAGFPLFGDFQPVTTGQRGERFSTRNGKSFCR